MIKILITFAILSSLNLQAQNPKDGERFELNSNRDTSIITSMGSKVFIEKNTFILPKVTSSSKNDMIVYVNEIVDQADMILSGITTNFEDSYLISNGMIRILAYNHDETELLAINPASDIAIEIPFSVIETGMKLYILNDSVGEWTETIEELEIDTCLNYRLHIDREYKRVKRKEYKEWMRENASVDRDEGLFGGRSINIRTSRNIYQIPIKADTSYICEDDLNYYKFIVNSSDWYNIDKLVNTSKPASIRIDTKDDLTYLLLIKDENSSLRPITRNNNNYRFPDLPRGLECIIFGYRERNDESYDIIVKPIIAGSRREYSLGLPGTVSKGEFKRVLKKLEQYYGRQ